MTMYRDLLAEEYGIDIGSIVGCGLDQLDRELTQNEIQRAVNFFEDYKQDFKGLGQSEKRESIANYMRDGTKIPLSQ